MSSRIIAKGLPKKISKERLQDHFSKFGQVMQRPSIYLIKEFHLYISTYLFFDTISSGY